MKLLIVIALLASLFAFSHQGVSAESGCVLSGYTSMGVPTSQAGGSFSCGSDSGSRWIQVCLQKYSASTACSPQLNYTGTSGSAIARDYTCYWTADIYGYRAWVWLYGEDHSTQVWISPTSNQWISC